MARFDLKNFEKADTALKVWLPQILVDRVNWLSKARDASRPDIIRALLFEHLYGRVAYESLAKYAANKRSEAELATARKNVNPIFFSSAFAPSNPDSGVQFSAARYTQVDLEHIGKSVADIDVKLPRQLKIDLESIAVKHRLSASSYVRKMLVLQLLGESVHTAWQDAVGVISKDVLTIEKG